MNKTTVYEIKQALFFFYGVILATLFVWCLLQGVLLHFGTKSFTAGVYYFLAMLSLGALLRTYEQAKKHRLD